ncbi:P-loop containing nucleoside triphosphate hydrolase [Pseudocohnilembus persalinus]|uniref:p-loop containing nucleoside triphosphate hydrolase n=1 Tax=Pseudocohnilembus persalinus TaxID=266149 RepID=A0A0V0QPF0_PSEPJ|nr:P-loop containing nucleoside triphosphate hydrolase [Pseudocohnilembus persalinus]|eukprot:KRX04174.1 P-loop containing nucleoside triphosphate hydrolase [Pseudocohnilembus persalinus]
MKIGIQLLSEQKVLIQCSEFSQNSKNNILYTDNQTCDQLLPDYILSRLYKFQIEGVNYGLQKYGRILLADEMGTGKTIQALALSWCFKKVFPCLIIVPTSLKNIWKQQIGSWLREIQETEVQVISKKGQAIQKNVQILIISYELAANYSQQLNEMKFKIAIADEAHYLKNPKSKRSESIIPLLQKCKHVILLTGTPAMNKPKDLYTMVSILRPDIFQYFKDFGNRYCDPQPSQWGQGMEYEGLTNSQELNFIMNKYFIVRRLKSEVLVYLPRKHREIKYIEPDQQYKQEIQQLLNQNKSIVQNLEELTQNPNVDIETKNDQQGKYDQWSSFTKSYQLTGKAKIQSALKQIEIILKTQDKIIIFAYHVEVINCISDFLNRNLIKYVKLDGSVDVKQRQTNVDLFQNDKRVQVSLLSLKASALGVTLTAASHIVFVELYWNPSIMIQAEDRAHRIGQQQEVTCTYLLCQDTLDSIMYKQIQKKMENIQQAIDDQQFTVNEDQIMADENINNQAVSELRQQVQRNQSGKDAD